MTTVPSLENKTPPSRLTLSITPIKQLDEYICSYLNLLDLIKIAQISKYFHGIVVSPYMFKVKAKQLGIILADDQIPKDLHLLKLKSVKHCTCNSPYDRFPKNDGSQEFERTRQQKLERVCAAFLKEQTTGRRPPDPCKKIEPLFKAYVVSLAEDA